MSYWSTLIGGIPGFFRVNPTAFLGQYVPLGVASAGYYSTEPLRATLGELVDFSLINRGETRLTVGAAHVRSSTMRYFDNRDSPIAVDHIMASGALPPAFPAVKIDDEFYWDGGILSNTPTEVIFDDKPRRSSLIFASICGTRRDRCRTISGTCCTAEGDPVFEPDLRSYRPPAGDPSAAPHHQ